MDFKKIEQIISTFKKAKVSMLSLEEGAFKISLKKSAVFAEKEPQKPNLPPKNIKNEDKINLTEIKSLSVGYFSSKIAASDIKNKKLIKKGAVLYTIEAMNLETKRTLDRDVIVHKTLVGDGSPVEYGQPLFLVEEK